VRTIAENLRDVQDRVARAAERRGRRAEEIRLVAVSKTQPVERIREAIAAGAGEIGENYVQEAETKLPQLEGQPVVRHFIGHLQKNKAGKAVALFDLVQTVDSVELAQALGRRALAIEKTLDVLIEVNISGEASKFGVAPERAVDLAAEVAAIPGLRLQGLMGIGPLAPGEAAERNSFRLLASLYEKLPAEHRQVLSMGMTGDFETAIAEGSTMLRIGTGIFGARRSS
jgi:pyridoxal phosphate enzyme (YggS family)